VPVDELAGAPVVPDVSVPGLPAERWVMVRGQGGTTEIETIGVVPLADGRDLEQAWQGLAGAWRGADVRRWRVSSADWQVRLAPGLGQAGQEVVVLLAESSAWLTGERWHYEVAYSLYQPAPVDLTVLWGSPVRVGSVTVDGVERAPLQPEPGRLWLPLSGQGLRQVRLRWQSEKVPSPPAGEDGESMPRPLLEVPRLEAARPVGVRWAADNSPWGPIWTIQLPPGWELADTSAAKTGSSPPKPPWGNRALSGPTRVFAVELARARAALEASRVLADTSEARAVLPPVQVAFYRAMKRAEQALAQGAGADGQGASQAVRQLREQNAALAKERKFDGVRSTAERQATTAPKEEGGKRKEEPDRSAGMPSPFLLPPSDGAAEGTPLSWLGEKPRVRLLPEEDRRWQEALVALAAWLGLLILLGLVSTTGRGRRVALGLCPEVLALLGALGWGLAGPTSVVLGLLAAGLFGRVLLLARGLRGGQEFGGRSQESAVRSQGAAVSNR
jgi:hypothetical protein